MSVIATRRAALDDGLKEKIRQRVKELLREKGGQAESEGQKTSEDEESSAGSIILFDELVSREARIAAVLVAFEFPTKEALEEYLEEHPGADRSKHRVVEEKRTPGKKEEPSEKSKPGEKEKDTSKKQKPEEKPDSKKPEKEPKVEDKSGSPLPDDTGHPSKVQEGPDRQIAVKDQLIDMFGAEAKDWNVHKLNPDQIQDDVVVKFPDGTEKKYGDLSKDEKERVDKAVSSGLAASRGVNDYTSVSVSSMKRNMANNLSLHDNKSVEETKLETKEPATRDNASETVSAIRDNGRNLVRKYANALSKVSRPMAEKYVDDVADAVHEALSDGSLAGVSQADLDEFMREDVKRLIHQEVETRSRSLGDHGVRHIAGNVRSSMDMLGELQQHGVGVSGKQKLMMVAVMASHDLGYTVGDVATDIRQGKRHVEQSKQLADEESERYDKVFGPDDGKKIREVIATHDSTDIDWEKDPMASAVRLADNTSMFGKDKVQDLFIRSPKAMSLACKLKMAAEMVPVEPKKPDRKNFESDEVFAGAKTRYDAERKDYEEQMADPEVQKRVVKSQEIQKSIKKQMHDVVGEMGVETLSDAVSLHAQIDEMTEEKFSTSRDILSRYSGELKGFKFNPDKKLMNVDMAYSPEGEVVDTLFGDDVAMAQFDKFAGDMKIQPMRGKRGKMTLKNPEGKRVCTLNIEGFDDNPIDTATTGAMRDFLKSTARGELRQAAAELRKPHTGSKEIWKARKVAEKAKDKFTEREWEQLMKAIDEGRDVEALAKKLDAWPLLEAEMEFLESKTASDLRRIASVVAESVIGDRVAAVFLAARGLQVRRKNRDVMRDTGGVSKGPGRKPEFKPERSDVRRPFRTKRKVGPDKDPDVDRNSDKESDTDMRLSFDATDITRRELNRWPRKFADAVDRARVGVTLAEQNT